jgi:hypothetical protein
MVTPSRNPENKKLPLKCAKQTEGQSIETRENAEDAGKEQRKPPKPKA